MDRRSWLFVMLLLIVLAFVSIELYVENAPKNAVSEWLLKVFESKKDIEE